MLIRAMTVADLDEVYSIEEETFADPWSKASFLDSISNPDNHYLVVELDGIVIGYCGYWGIAGEGHIYNVAVKSSYRSQGIGYRMLEELIIDAESRGVGSLTLEVRKSNVLALDLYKKLGFVEMGVRRGFYTKPSEDAIIMWRNSIQLFPL